MPAGINIARIMDNLNIRLLGEELSTGFLHAARPPTVIDLGQKGVVSVSFQNKKLNKANQQLKYRLQRAVSAR